jgi:hypothetical protein
MMMARTTVTMKMAKTRYGSSSIEWPRLRNVSEVMRAMDMLHWKGWKRQHNSKPKRGKDDGDLLAEESSTSVVQAFAKRP